MQSVVTVALALFAGVSTAPGTAPTPIPPDPASDAQSIAYEQQDGMELWRPTTLQDGQLWVAEIAAPDCDNLQLQWLGASIRPVGGKGHWQALLPTPLGQSGEQALAARCGAHHARFRVPVVEGVYSESVLSVDPKFDQYNVQRLW